MTGEQRYHQVMTKARLLFERNLRAFLSGERLSTGEPLYDLQRRLLIEEFERLR